MTQIDRINEARAAIRVLDPIIFAALAGRELVQDNECVETITTDGQAIGYNSAWISTLQDAEVVFSVAAIGYMLAMNYFDQRGVRPPRTWAIACGYATNAYLVANEVGKMVPNALYDERFAGKTAVEIFEVIDPVWVGKTRALGLAVDA